MDTLRAMQVFVRVVELGSLSAAARDRHTSQPTVSKLVAALEDRLGVRLIERSTTHVVPTEQGKRFYERSKRVLDEFDGAVADARGSAATTGVQGPNVQTRIACRCACSRNRARTPRRISPLNGV